MNHSNQNFLDSAKRFRSDIYKFIWEEGLRQQTEIESKRSGSTSPVGASDELQGVLRDIEAKIPLLDRLLVNREMVKIRSQSQKKERGRLRHNSPGRVDSDSGFLSYYSTGSQCGVDPERVGSSLSKQSDIVPEQETCLHDDSQIYANNLTLTDLTLNPELREPSINTPDNETRFDGAIEHDDVSEDSVYKAEARQKTTCSNTSTYQIELPDNTTEVAEACEIREDRNRQQTVQNRRGIIVQNDNVDDIANAPISLPIDCKNEQHTVDTLGKDNTENDEYNQAEL